MLQDICVKRAVKISPSGTILFSDMPLIQFFQEYSDFCLSKIGLTLISERKLDLNSHSWCQILIFDNLDPDLRIELSGRSVDSQTQTTADISLIVERLRCLTRSVNMDFMDMYFVDFKEAKMSDEKWL